VRGRGAALRARVQAGPLRTPVRRLADGSYLARIYARPADRDGGAVRGIACTPADPARVRAGKPHRLVTSLLGPVACPAHEPIALDHGRGGQELAFDELKTHWDDRKVAVRSQRPAGVAQEVSGLRRAHGVLRALRGEAAGVAPRALSFTGTLRVVLIRLPAAPRGPTAALAGWSAGLRAAVGQQRLRPRRERINPRVLKGRGRNTHARQKGNAAAASNPFASMSLYSNDRVLG
jgi:hypothetical protein